MKIVWKFNSINVIPSVGARDLYGFIAANE